MSLIEQEYTLISDLIFILQGIEGEYIRILDKEKNDDKLVLSINPMFDSSLSTLVYRILPLAVDYHTVAGFCRKFSSYSKGLVIQAYSSALKVLIEEYLTQICQFETELHSKAGPRLSVQNLFWRIERMQQIMKLLAGFCNEIAESNIVGGALISFLNKKCTELMGDKVAVDLCKFLVGYSSKPYINMLERWLYSGEIRDPHHEFMVRENDDPKKFLTGTAFDEINNWECRYYLKLDLCPSSLTLASEKILNCGKYLNIIFSCADSKILCHSQTTPVKRLSDLANDHAVLQQVDHMHNYASRTLMQLLTDRYNLLKCFKSMKHYFLTDQGDWLVHFLELADKEELRSDLADARLHRLESFLDIAVRSSLLASDLLRDEIKITLRSNSLTGFLLHLLQIDQNSGDSLSAKFSTNDKKQQPTMKVYDALTLKYDAQWPLSIIFNRKIMLQYEIIFRRLLQCKYVERILSLCWMSKKFRTAPLYSLLLHQMLTFLKNYLYYATAEVIEPYWHKFSESTNSECLTIDDALKHHSLFLDNCTKDCLLTDGQLIESFQKLLDIIMCFASKFDSSLCGTKLDTRDSTADELKQKFDEAQLNVLDRMQSLSASSQERMWTDVAYRLDLK